jgi:predicted double-glycine peptidase
LLKKNSCVVTGLNKSTVSALVDELLAEELILKTRTGESQDGRKSVTSFY